jgi:hypothetical protein
MKADRAGGAGTLSTDRYFHDINECMVDCLIVPWVSCSEASLEAVECVLVCTYSISERVAASNGKNVISRSWSRSISIFRKSVEAGIPKYSSIGSWLRYE